MTYENLFSIGSSMRIALGIIFALFIICFIAVVIEEVFLGGRRRRKAVKNARKLAMEDETAKISTAAPAPQNLNTHHPRQ
jgi:cbb3-type cytochrome oxidase subunit 3